MTPAARLASILRARLGCPNKPDLYDLCDRLGLRVKEVQAQGFEGALVRSKMSQKGIVAVRDSIREQTRKRFTIAHEIGHFVIPQHRLLDNTCLPDAMERFGAGQNQAEAEANEFAAELLLPAEQLRAEMNLREPSMTTIGATARDYGTSLTATTYRYVDLTQAACAMIWSHNNRAVWFHRNEAFPFWLPLPGLPTRHSIAGKLFAGGATPTDFAEVPADAWLERTEADRVTCLLEHSVPFRSYGAVLTLLWILKMDRVQVDAEDEARLPELTPEDFTLQRRRWPK